MMPWTMHVAHTGHKVYEFLVETSVGQGTHRGPRRDNGGALCRLIFNPYPTAFPYGNGMVLHFYQQQESSTTKTVHKVINKGLKTYV